VTVVVACFSFWWSLAIGACLFIQGEVLWSRANVVRRSQKVIDFFESLAQPLLDYFPLTLQGSKVREVVWTFRTVPYLTPTRARVTFNVGLQGF